jgi:glycosyltransferase involved in cell wall biosynthesis
MRILYFADIRFPLERANGIQTMETCHALADRGHDVRLVVKRDTHVPPRDPFDFYGLDRPPAPGRLVVEHANAPAGGGIAARIGYLSFAAGRAVGRTRADIVTTRDLGVAALLLRIPASMRPPLVYESHGYAPDVSAALPEMITTARPPSAAKLRRLAARENMVWKQADGYVAITRGIVERLEMRCGPRARVSVVPDGVRAAAAVTPLPTARTIAYAGHLYPWKGVDVLLRAFAGVADADLLVVGGHDREPDLHRVKRLAAELGLEERITFTGLLEPSRVAEQLVRAQILVLPNPPSAISTHATSPLKLFEYMAAGRAIVASDLPAIREVLQHEVTALLVPPGDPAALAAAVNRLFAERPLAERLARAAAAEAVHYTWSRRAERLERLFEEVRAA